MKQEVVGLSEVRSGGRWLSHCKERWELSQDPWERVIMKEQASPFAR